MGKGTISMFIVIPIYCGFGGLEVACWPLVPKFAGSHPAEDVEFLGDTRGDAWWRKLERLTQIAQ